MQNPKVALVVDWLTTYGGAESVIESFTRIFPDAPLFTTVYSPDSMKSLGHHFDVRTSFLRYFPRVLQKNHPFLLPLLPRAIESLNLSGYDIILSSSSFVGKGVLTNPDQLHICYCHAPSRYFWGNWQEYLKDFPIPSVFKLFLPRMFTRYRQWDFFAAQRPDIFWANSDFISRSIKKYYGRDSEVIFPPVDTKCFSIGKTEKENWYLGFGRLVSQKKFELLILAFLQMPEKKLIIAGVGRNEPALRKLASNAKNIVFYGFVPDSKAPKLLAKARALLSPQLEDAGITALEALSVGTPVIAYGKGGALTSLKDRKTGILFENQTAESIINAIKQFEEAEDTFSREKLSEYAKQFSREIFEKNIHKKVMEAWKEFCKR